jgi:ABC-type glycerol-3-phosphate transport system substrate-binding protein
MKIIRTTFAAAVSALVLAGAAQAQSSTAGSTATQQSERDRGVPGVDVDVGRNASGATCRLF